MKHDNIIGHTKFEHVFIINQTWPGGYTSTDLEIRDLDCPDFPLLSRAPDFRPKRD